MKDFEVLVQKCVDAYATFYDDSLSLDFVKVSDTKMRGLILRDKAYREETKHLRAARIMGEIKELETLNRLTGAISSDAEELSSLNSRTESIDKDMLNMRLKASQELRDLRRDVASDDAEVLNATNIYFVAMTREDFEAMETVEIVAGEEDDGSTLKEMTGTTEALPVGGAAEVFTYDEDGNVTGLGNVDAEAEQC